MLKGRGRDPRAGMPSTPAHLVARPPAPVQAHLNTRTLGQQRTPFVQQRAPLAKPEPDYEVVEFPSDQYVNAKLQPPPPPPPRPPTGHPVEAGASCGLCGGGGARVRCSECGRRALCASCDDMYHRHPKRRHHQRQALPLSQLRDERPPLPPKSNAPVPPPRRHKLSGDRSSASPRPPGLDQRRATLGHLSTTSNPSHQSMMLNNAQQIPAHLQKLSQPTSQLGSMPYLPTNMHPAAPVAHPQLQTNTMGHNMSAWGRQRGSLQGFNMPPNMAVPTEPWESPDSVASGHSSPWTRPLRRGASVLDLGGAPPGCAGCAHCGPVQWRYGSCASLDHQWPAGWPPQGCCMPHPHDPHMRHPHLHPSQTPQPYRRADSRTVSRAASRAGSRAASPAASVRSRTSRRTKHRTPSPPLPSSDADSESDSDDHPPLKPPPKDEDRRQQNKRKPVEDPRRQEEERRPAPQEERRPAPQDEEDGSLGPAPPPPSAPWQCEHCTFVNEPGERVCAVCCRTPTTEAKVIADVNNSITKLKVSEKNSPSPVRKLPQQDSRKQNGEETKVRTTKERVSTGCGPSPPKEEIKPQKTNRLVTPTREQYNSDTVATEHKRTRHDMGVGPSPPRDNQETRHSMGTGPSPPRETVATVRPSPYRETKTQPEPPTRHSVSVGPSPPRENARSSIATSPLKSSSNVYKKSAGTSPPRDAIVERRPSSRANVSNTGTSPPPQSISTQTYEVAAAGRQEWERAPSASRSRPRRRFARDDSRRERSHSRHSLSSDTRESERSARTSGGRWEWRERERDSSPPEWSGSERRRLTRRASHLDLRRSRPHRRASFYGSEAASPEPASNRTLSLEALVGAGAGARREAERGLELARLMSEAERLGFSAAEVHAALAQSPAAPLAWLSERWPSLCAGVRAAAARLAPGAPVSELEARAALARHRGAMWPAVTDCVERHRRQAETVSVGEEGRLRGHVWGSPAGADDDAAPPATRHPHRRREDSSDEFEEPTPKFQDDDWMYLPLDLPVTNTYVAEDEDVWRKNERRIDSNDNFNGRTDDIANKLKSFLIQAGVPSIDENLLLKGLLAENNTFRSFADSNIANMNNIQAKPQTLDLGQSENDFINAYNALTRSSPLPSINNTNNIEMKIEKHSINNQELKNVTVDRPANIKEGKKEVERTANNNQSKRPNANNGPNQIHIRPATSSSSTLPPDEYERKDEEIFVKETTEHENSNALSRSRNNKDSKTITVPTKINVTGTEIIPPSVFSDIKTPVLVVTKPLSSEKIANDVNMDIGDQHFPVPMEPKISPQQVTPIPVSATHTTPVDTPVSKDLRVIEKDKHGEEKTTNLSDIVDNTQRLIQQMKEEINSDINYNDDTSISQSEADNSSNESDFSTEHESSYSESEEGTEDITSDDNDSSSPDEVDDDVGSGKSGTIITRTSSEDNEQFEEAMDHIEEQNESFKQTNIEILDSIARSLQEDHTISVQVNQSNEQTEIMSTVAKVQKQDSNNNVFVEVNSFDEIYEQLNSTKGNNKNNKTKQVRSLPQSNVVGEPVATNSIRNQIIVPEKQEIHLTLFKPEAPIQLFISENQHPVFNAVIDNVQEPVAIANIEQILVIDSAIKAEIATSYLIAGGPSSQSANVIPIPSDDKENSDNDEYSSQSDSSRTTISPVKEKHNHNINKPISNLQTKIDTQNDTIPVNNVVPETNNEDNINGTKIIHVEPKTKTQSPEHALPINNIEVKDKSKSPDILASPINNKETKAKSTSPEKLASPINNSETKAKSISPEKVASPINNSKSGAKSTSPEKIPFLNTTNENSQNIKNPASKSNIPKPVKIQPNKQKGDHPPAKVITSKVPVRRGSLKQPAPAPPKAHFGNVQSGHVKQLQTRLFNDKFPKVTTKQVEVIEVKASTSSTMNKKRPAPLPPKGQEKQVSPPKESPKEKKSNYFRETCRTEDEWTESDSEDSQSQVQVVKASEEAPRAPSPPPPVTVRRVSGQLIDLARIRLLEGSPERQARMLLAEGATESWEQAQLAVELVARGAEPPAALLAALECADLDAALTYLHQDCELCACRLPEHEMVSMLRCTHRCCRECARLYFTVQITERSIADCVCPYCKEPELESLPEDAWLEYFAHLDILLKTLLETDVHELFQRKLRDRTLARDPNFRWCVECSSGFFVHPKQKKLRCPECKSVSCATCRKPWSPSHEGLTCEQYATWLEDNDPERSVAAVQQHLRENGLECPRCHFKYSLSRGGCMHFTCTQCKYEFCYGCGKPFMMGARCGLSEYCAKLGLHAHHPRNCLFYLRDKEPHDLQTLLQMNNVTYETEAPEGGARCPVQLQRETPTGLVDCACGADVQPGHAGLCKGHYVEYLAGLARALDPIPIMEVSELVAELRRRALPLPDRGPWDTDPVYAGMCAEIVKEKIPLD